MIQTRREDLPMSDRFWLRLSLSALNPLFVMRMVHGTDRAVGKGCSMEAGSSRDD